MTEKYDELNSENDIKKNAPLIVSKSNSPVWWAMFGLSGTFNAFFLPVVILIIGIFPFIGLVKPQVLIWLFSSRLGSFLVAGVSLFVLWNSLFRFKYLFHDLKIPLPYPKTMLYGVIGGMLTVVTIIAMTSFYRPNILF